jgi:ABC-type dipeptide/oligopeptide/nickel transport system permease subunit
MDISSKATVMEVRARSHPLTLLQGLLRSPAGLTGAALFVLLIITAVFAPQIAPFGPTEGDLLSAKTPPAWHEKGSWLHPLGTDQLGQDVFSRSVYGSRVSLTVGFFGVL